MNKPSRLRLNPVISGLAGRDGIEIDRGTCNGLLQIDSDAGRVSSERKKASLFAGA